MKVLVLVIVLIAFNSYGHEGHGNPGAIPPAPHGGVLKEAEHMHHGSHDHDHSEAAEREVFFEGLYKDGKIIIFPLQLDPKGHKHFINLKLSEFSKVKIETIDARKKKKLSLKHIVEKNGWVINVSKKRTRRYIVDVSGIFKGAKYHAKVQVEKK